MISLIILGVGDHTETLRYIIANHEFTFPCQMKQCCSASQIHRKHVK